MTQPRPDAEGHFPLTVDSLIAFTLTMALLRLSLEETKILFAIPRIWEVQELMISGLTKKPSFKPTSTSQEVEKSTKTQKLST